MDRAKLPAISTLFALRLRCLIPEEGFCLVNARRKNNSSEVFLFGPIGPARRGQGGESWEKIRHEELLCRLVMCIVVSATNKVENPQQN